MITFIHGENEYASKQYLQSLFAKYDGVAAIERLEGSDISVAEFADAVGAISLFSSKRLVIVYQPSNNKKLWEKFAEPIVVPEGTHLVLFETTPDKRTKTFKQLSRYADVRAFPLLDEKELITFTKEQAMKLDLRLAASDIQHIVDRTGNNQWHIQHALERLALAGEVSAEVIDQQIEATPTSSVFTLVDATLQKSTKRVQQLIQQIRANEDPYFFFGLLSSQMFQLIALSHSSKGPSEVAKDMGVHPYPLQKMNTFAKQLSKDDARTVADILADCDNKIKRSGNEPWTLIEQALLKLASR